MSIIMSDGISQINGFIYQVYVKKSSGKMIVQTGFRLNGTKGIITCLHGVAGAVSISASNSSINPLRGLQLTQVDMKNDLALLQSEEILRMNDQGLIKNPIKPRDGIALKVLGYPSGISSLNQRSVLAGRPLSNIFAGYIPPSSATFFESRNSPSPSIEIFYIEGSLVHGQSGAPLLDLANKVVGIVNGGIKEGAAGISWAIPINNISWIRANAVSTEIKKLGSKENDGLFATAEADIRDSLLFPPNPPNMKNYYLDADGDGYGDIRQVLIAESAPLGYIKDGSDCCDTDPLLSDYKTAQTFFEDKDGDGHGTGNQTKRANKKPYGFVELSDDADDTDPYLFNRSTAKLYYIDQDADGYGTASTQKQFNQMPSGYVEDNQDMDDTDARVHPGQTEFFTSPSNGGTWDYNCDRTIQSQYTNIGHVASGSIELRACLTSKCCYVEGWIGPEVPGPGQIAVFGISCDPPVTKALYGIPIRPMKINTEMRIQGAH